MGRRPFGVSVGLAEIALAPGRSLGVDREDRRVREDDVVDVPAAALKHLVLK
jgi:hypothetical protein